MREVGEDEEDDFTLFNGDETGHDITVSLFISVANCEIVDMEEDIIGKEEDDEMMTDVRGERKIE